MEDFKKYVNWLCANKTPEVAAGIICWFCLAALLDLVFG